MELIIFILFGLVIGSFLNVLIYRLPIDQPITYPPSHCPRCGTPLKPVDLIPVLSWIRLGGRCAYCHAPIAWRYPLVELLTAAAFATAWLATGTWVAAVKIAVLFALLIAIAFIDLDHQIIPDPLVLGIFLWGLFWQIVLPSISWGQAIGGFFLGGGILLLAAVLSRGGMGGGDIKLLAAAGFILGPAATGIALFISVLVGSIVGVALIVKKIRKRKEYIPFGPFLALGIVASVLWGQQLLSAYLRLIGW
jgi:leader peptidase (prepilin peptidase) / N-methyltransferase